MEDNRLAEIRARWAKATPGPWKWRGNRTMIELISPPNGINVVMDFVRKGNYWGMPRFAEGGILYRATRWAIRPESHKPWRITGIDHPDAIAIASAPTDVADLLAEIDRLRSLLTPAAAVFAQAATAHLDSDDAMERWR